MERTYLRDLSTMFTEFTIALLIRLPFLQSVNLNTLIQSQQFSQGSREFTLPLLNLYVGSSMHDRACQIRRIFSRFPRVSANFSDSSKEAKS